MTTTLTMAGLGDWLTDLFFRRPAGSEFGETADGVFMFIFWWSVVLFVGLMGLMLVFMWKYRRRPGTTGPRSASHNTPLDLFWTVVPTIFLVFMFFYGFWGYADALVAPAGALLLDVEAQQWSWTVAYPNGAETGPIMSTPDAPEHAYTGKGGDPQAPIRNLGSKSVPLIIVPVGTPIQLRMISKDVIHAFWMPDFRIKFDVMPNRYTNVWFEAREDQIGDHWVFCAEYCGDDHSEMLAVMRVLPKADYDYMITEKWGPAGMEPAKYGQILFRGRCSSCHTDDGSKLIGPSWLNLYGYEHQYTNGKTILNDDNHIRESILNPGKDVRLGYPDQMTSFAGVLNEKAISAIIAYMKTISDKAPKGETAPQEGGQPQNGQEPPKDGNASPGAPPPAGGTPGTPAGGQEHGGSAPPPAR
jgi:cytochrome c oxidase subunit 2